MNDVIKADNGIMVVPQVAKALGIHEVSVRRLILAGKLRPKIKVGGMWLFDPTEVAKFKESYNRAIKSQSDKGEQTSN